MDKQEYKIALLIDSENVSVKYIKVVINEIAKYGKIVISRFYGDLNKLSKEWHQTAIDFAIKPMHQYNVASGKNAADLAMALDALEMMYQERVNTFFIVTSDSDFTPLAMKLKEGGMHVVGVGNEKKVTSAFKMACNEFKYFEYLGDDEDEEELATTKPVDIKGEIVDIIMDIIVESGVDNKIQLSRLGDILTNRFSDFDSRKYGAKSLSSLVKTIEGVEITQEKTTTYVSLKSALEIDIISKAVYEIISRNKSKEMVLTKLKQELEKRFDNFQYKTFGFTKFSNFITSIKYLTVNKNIVKYTK
ncbi:MAG: NYN domain-containing protein [Acholeplasmataceae bacterium]|nr:MAG: NYN domain-containing protein [Acholeplasmataceae bacterium]